MSFALGKKIWRLATVATIATVGTKDGVNGQKTGGQTLCVATVATVAMGPTLKNESTATAKVVPISTPDRWCWPNGPAMNGQEISVFNQRENLFIARGWDAAEAVAERLVRRDRESDDRVVCLECVHYTKRWCANAKAAELSPTKSSTQIAIDLISLFQRCPGFLALLSQPVTAAASPPPPLPEVMCKFRQSPPERE
jgi:hypothetical protein